MLLESDRSCDRCQFSRYCRGQPKSGSDPLTACRGSCDESEPFCACIPTGNRTTAASICAQPQNRACENAASPHRLTDHRDRAKCRLLQSQQFYGAVPQGDRGCTARIVFGAGSILRGCHEETWEPQARSSVTKL
jgi:hypothetical protein